MLDKKILYFMAIVEEGSFSAAAKRLFISQPALSYQISILEENLGVSLFNREKNKAILNDTGKEFYKNCRKIFLLTQDIIESIKKAKKSELRIGFSGAYENRELLDIISQFKILEPSVSFSFYKNNFEGNSTDLLNSKVDISFGILSNFKNFDEFTIIPLYDYEICVISSFTNPLSSKDVVDLDDLKDEDFILLHPNFGQQFYKDIIDSFKKDNFKPKIKKFVNSFDELTFSVSTNEGIALASYNVIRGNEVKPIKLLNSHHVSSYVIAFRKDNNDLLTKKFAEFCAQYFRNIK